MAIPRSAIALYLDSQFSELAASVNQTDSSDGATGYGPDIDNALRVLGKTESELADATVEDGQRSAIFALAEYFALRRFLRKLGGRVNFSGGDESYNFTDQRAHVKAMMEDAKKECAALGYDVSGDGWIVASLNLDWMEAELTS